MIESNDIKYTPCPVTNNCILCEKNKCHSYLRSQSIYYLFCELPINHVGLHKNSKHEWKSKDEY